MVKKTKNKLIKIQFGSGSNVLKNYINVDITKEYGAQVKWDMNKFPYPFPSNYADEILCEMTLEHIMHPSRAVQEFHRILKKNGTVKITVPHFSGLYALHADIHIRSYGIGFFYSFLENKKDLWNRKGKEGIWTHTNVKFKEVKVDLLFPKGKLFLISLPFQLIFNSGKTMQAVYEHFFSNFYRANELHVIMKHKVK